MTANMLPQTPSQTVGPYFAYGITAAQYGYDWNQLAAGVLVRDDTPGTRIRVEGRVLDGNGAPINDAVVEIWQADAAGAYPGAAAFADKDAFHGFGRFGTGTLPGNAFRFETVKPGSVDGSAPHLNVAVMMRGLLIHAYTRVYFADETAANAADPVLALVPEDRRATLIATPADTPAGRTYTFDIHMQGPAETVFFAF